MADAVRHEQVRRIARLAAGRLWRSRGMLLAAIAALIASTWVAPGYPWMVVLCSVLLLVVAMLAPGGRRPADPSGGVSPADGTAGSVLSGEELAEAVPDPLVVFDATGAVVRANASARDAFGPLNAGMSLLLKFRAPEMQAAIERVRTGAARIEQADFVERVPVDRVYRATIVATGTPGVFVLVFKDQSEARRIDRMRADFIANASHELRTPLASISGFIETLRGPARNDAVARENFLTIMLGQTARMARLIDDLLSLSRLEMKPYLPPDAKVDLRLVVGDVIASLAPLAADTGVTVERQLGDAPLIVHGDRDELFQVFENLLENACKYGQSGGRVIVSAERVVTQGQNEAAVTVRDFGPGIPAEHIPRITERFYRVDVETSRAQKGTGLGLAIVKHILTRHRARLSIRSTVGEGSAFTVLLPLD